jgi:hypothetical protein
MAGIGIIEKGWEEPFPPPRFEVRILERLVV